MPPPKRPPTPSKPPPPAEEEGPSTFFVRMGPNGEPLGDEPAEPPPMPNAPKKGLQVSLPDDEPLPPPPKPKPVAAPAAVDKKGRRGNWWDQKDERELEALKKKDDGGAATFRISAADLAKAQKAQADEPGHDGKTAVAKIDEALHDGATAMVKVDEVGDGEHDGATAFVSAEYLEKAKVTQKDSEGEHDGATAMFKAPQAEPEVDEAEEQRRKQLEARKRREQQPPPPQEYKPQPAPDYAGHQGQPSSLGKWVKRLAITAVVLGLFGGGALVGLYFYLSQSLPRIESLADYKPLVSTHVVAADGTLIGEFYKERRTVVPLDKMPPHLRDAVISAEDKDFYKHHGVSVLGLARAAIVDLLSGRKRQGASTITQQVVKTFFLSKEKKFSRKVKEILLAFKIEKDLSKDDILHLYLNQINFGRAHYGVEEAARYYFNKHVWEVDLGEASLLAGLPQNPARLNPRFHPASAKRRQTYVLDRMLANKKISQADHDREVEKPIALPPPPQDPPGSWYLEEVKRRLIEQYGEAAVNTAGMTIEVAMDPKLQRTAESALKEGLRVLDKRQGWRGAELNLGEGLEEVRAALARRYRALAPTPGAVMVFDLGNLGEKERATADGIARAARLRVLEPGGIYAGIVTKITGNRGVDVELAPDIVGWVPFETMKWARPFRPTGATDAPSSPSQVVKRGDVVQVAVTKVVFRKTSAISMRGRELELALEQVPLVQGAFIALDVKTRNVQALVGGYDIARSQFNRATQAKRQPGSAFKPILYAAAIETGKYTPATRLDDSPEVITDPFTGKTWKPQNFEKEQFDGPLPLRRALAMSKNTIAVKLLLEVGLDRVRQMARLCGLSTEVPRSYTAALGTGEVIPIELVNAFATIAGLGRKAEPVMIRKVRAREGAVMWTAESTSEPSLKPEVAYITADLMRAVIEDPEGTARSLGVLMRPIAGKTGTASEHRDAWFVGFTPSLVAGAWVGFDNHDRLGPLETGGHAAGPIWLRFMKAATSGAPIEEWPAPPPGVTVAKVNRNTGQLSTDANDPFAQKEVFLAGTEPTAPAPTANQEQFLKEH